MAPTPVSRRSLLIALATLCGQFAGCRHSAGIPRHTWVRDPYDPCGAAAISTIVLPTLGEGPWDLRRDFHRALSSHLRKSQHRKIVEPQLPAIDAACSCPPTITTWDEQLQMLSGLEVMQAVVSKVTYLQPTAPVKLGIVVELRDVITRESLGQVEGLWDALKCHPAPPPSKCISKRVSEPPWSGELHKISPRHLLEQAAREISLDLEGIGLMGQIETVCDTEAGAPAGQ